MTMYDALFALLIVIGFYIIFILKSGSKYLNAKRKKTLQNRNVLERTNISLSLLHMIDTLIDIELSNRLSFLAIANKPYNMLNINRDVETVTKTVYHAIKQEVYSDPDILIDSDYIMMYITTQCSTKLMITLKQANIAFYYEDTDIGEKPKK